MSSHFEKSRTDDSESRILPLINVVFLLLIFFMVLGSLRTTEPFAVGPPESTSKDVSPTDTMRLLYSLDGRVAIDGQVLPEAELLQQLKLALERNPQTQIQLKADAKLEGNQLVQFMEQISEAGVERLYLLTLPAD